MDAEQIEARVHIRWAFAIIHDLTVPERQGRHVPTGSHARQRVSTSPSTEPLQFSLSPFLVAGTLLGILIDVHG